jgi:hypothetical protein
MTELVLSHPPVTYLAPSGEGMEGRWSSRLEQRWCSRTWWRVLRLTRLVRRRLQFHDHQGAPLQPSPPCRGSPSAWIKLLPLAAHSSLSMFSHFPPAPGSSCMRVVERRATTSCRQRRRPPLHAPALHPPPSTGVWKAERSPPRRGAPCCVFRVMASQGSFFNRYGEGKFGWGQRVHMGG